MGSQLGYFYPKEKSRKKCNELIYKNFYSYINDIDIYNQINLPESKYLDNEELYKIIYKYQKNEKSLFSKGDEVIYKYFLCDNKKLFKSKEFLEENQKITNEFRYFGLALFFGNPESFMLNFYLNLFLNVNKGLGGSFYSNDRDEKRFILDLNNLKSSCEWIVIIPCLQFPLLIDEITKFNKVNSILVHCMGIIFIKKNILNHTQNIKDYFIIIKN